MKVNSLITLVCSLSISALCLANDDPAGWRWYNEPQKVKEAQPQQVAPKENTVTTVMSATEQMKVFHQMYEEINAAATIDPGNMENRLRLMRMNNFITEQTSIAGMTFKKALLEHPELSYTKDRPVEQAARATYLALKREKKERSVKAMAAEGWGFFFVYEGKDAISQKLAPSIQDFANTYGIELLGISKDGKTLNSIDNNKIDDGRIVVPFTPALILVNPQTHEQKPLVYGFISQSDLLGRFYNVMTDYEEPDF